MPDLVNEPWEQNSPRAPDPIKEGAPSTVKRWDDCGIEEKIERLRDALRGQRYLAGLISRINGDIERLGDHNHDALGRVVVGFRHDRGVIAQGVTKANDLLA